MKMKKREKIIREHLKEMEEVKKKLPKEWWPFENVTQITYGIFRKTITPEEIKEYKLKIERKS